MRLALPAVALLALLAPLAAAGTPEEPELRDAAGDQSVPAPLGSAFDVLAGWVAPAPHGKLTVALQLADVTAQSSGTHEVTWAVGGPLNPDGEMVRAGVRFTLQGGSADAVVLMDTGEGFGQVRTEVDADVTPGAPGLLEATFDPAEVPYLLGATLHKFAAASRPPPVGGLVSVNGQPVDEAAGDGAFALPGAFYVGVVAPPPGAPDLAGEETADLPGAADLTGAWMRSEGSDLLLTFRLRSLTPDTLAECGGWGLWAYASGDGDEGMSMYLSATFERPWLERLYLSADKGLDTAGGRRTVELDGNLTLQYGSPGYAQVRLVDADYTGPTLDEGYSSVRASCDLQGQTLQDHLDGGAMMLPAPPVAALLAGLAALAFLRRRAA